MQSLSDSSQMQKQFLLFPARDYQQLTIPQLLSEDYAVESTLPALNSIWVVTAAAAALNTEGLGY